MKSSSSARAAHVRAAAQAAARAALYAAGTLAVILVMAGLPLLISDTTARLVLDPMRVVRAARDFLLALADGSVFTFASGYTNWDFRQMGLRFLTLSFAYTAFPGAIGIGLGSFAGAARRARKPGAADRFADFALATPDFLVIFLVQLGVTWLVDATGLGIGLSWAGGRVSPLAFALMATYPFFLSYRAAASASRSIAGESFVTYARAKGLPEGLIVRRHIGAALIPALEAQLPVIIAFMQGSLFFVEKAFSLPGMARLLYDSAFAGRRRVVLRVVYQYDHVVLSLIGLALSCVAVYCVFRAALALARKALTHE
jgi:hypothetical protein